MKTTAIRLLSLMLAALPMTAAAQTNIKAAFDAIIKCPDAEITESHTLEKDPSTGTKTGQSDLYRFVLPASKAGLIEKAFAAFDKDAEMAYSINRGKATEKENPIVLAVGEAENTGVYITAPGADYIYSLFLAPLAESPAGNHRYAYGMNCKEEDGQLVGRLAVTYATTLKYRQQTEQQRQYNMLRNMPNGAYVVSANPQQSWFEKLMSYFQGMTSANTQTRIALATKAYKVIHASAQYPEVTEADKNAVREILKGMISDKKYSESVLNELLNQCLAGIK